MQSMKSKYQTSKSSGYQMHWRRAWGIHVDKTAEIFSLVLNLELTGATLNRTVDKFQQDDRQPTNNVGRSGESRLSDSCLSL